MADSMKGRGTELASHLNGLGASAFYLASAILLIVSSALTIANTQKGFAITGTVSGACLIVRHPLHTRRMPLHNRDSSACFLPPSLQAGGAITLFAELFLIRTYKVRGTKTNLMRRQKIMIFSTLPIIAGTTIINHGYRCLLPLSFLYSTTKNPWW